MTTPSLIPAVSAACYRRLFGIAAFTLLCGIARAQPTTPTPGTDTIKLAEFTVSTTSNQGYVVKDTLAGGRVSTSIMALPSSVTVVGADLMKDLASLRPLDAARLVSGVTEGTIPLQLNRYTLRGIQGDNGFVDGFIQLDQSNTDVANLDRIEVVKGPSALLFPNGPIGGLLNQITKSPQEKVARSLAVQVGSFDSNRIDLDLTGPLLADKTILYRVVAAYQDAEGYLDNYPSRKNLLAPSFTVKLGRLSLLTVKGEYYKVSTALNNGVPWDFNTGRRAAVPRRVNFAQTADLGTNLESTRYTGSGLLTTRFSEVVSMRLAARAMYSWSPQYGDLFGGGAFSSANGNRTQPVQFADQKYTIRRASVQNDWLANFNTGPVRHEFAAGWDGSHATFRSRVRTSAVGSPVDIFNFVPPRSQPTTAASRTDTLDTNDLAKIYAIEQIFLIDDKVTVSGGAVGNWFKTQQFNNLSNLTSSTLDGTQWTKQYGVVYRPLKTASVYYGYNENFQPGRVGSNGVIGPNAVGASNEVGVKVLLLDERVILTAAHYDMTLEGFQVASFDANGQLNFTTLPNTTSKGWEVDANASVNKNLSLIASYSSMEAKSNALLLRASTKMAWATWAKYRFTAGPLKHLEIGVGANHQGARAGDVGNTYFLAPSTIANAVVTYTLGAYRFSLNVDNLTDKNYDLASLNRLRVYQGPGRNLRLSSSYSF